MADVSVRPAIPADAAPIAALQVEIWRSAYGPLLPPGALDELTVDAAREQWTDAIGQPPTSSHDVLVALEGRTVVGFAAVAPAGDTDLDPAAVGELLVLLVDERARRSGHGSRLMTAAISRLRDAGRTSAVAWAFEADTVLVEFLVGAGWAQDGTARQLDAGRPVSQVRLHTDIRET